MLYECNSLENTAKTLDANWYAIKLMYEKKYRELIRDSKNFTSINDIQLTINSIKNQSTTSMKYIVI